MQSPDGAHLLLAGDPALPDHGFLATVTITGPRPSPDRELFDRLGVDALLTAPYLGVVGAVGQRRIVVGSAWVAVIGDEDAAVTLAVEGVWSEAGGWHQETGPPEVDGELLPTLARPPHRVDGDARARATTAAKGIAEGSRGALSGLRAIRYGLERQIADLLAQRRNASLRPLLAEIIELSIATSRARDRARSAVRGGLSIWLWDSDAYHRTREAARERGDTHLAAVRHCEAMDAELAEEASRLNALLNSMSTFAVAQDGEAQQRFNMVAAGAAAGLALPALILSLYGADSFLPLTADTAWRALLPIAVTAFAAAVIALRRMPGRTSSRHYLAAGGLVATLVLVLLVAGLLAPGS